MNHARIEPWTVPGTNRNRGEAGALPDEEESTGAPTETPGSPAIPVAADARGPCSQPGPQPAPAQACLRDRPRARAATASAPDTRPLAGLLMRRAGWVAAAVSVAALALGLLRMNQDIDAEVDSAMALAEVIARLVQLGSANDGEALRELAAVQARQPLRHLTLTVADAAGQHLLDPPPEVPAPRWLQPLLALHRDWLSTSDARAVQWSLARPDGSSWTVTLAASRDSERREAMVSLLGMLALLAVCIAGLTAAMRMNLARALAPLSALLAAIAGIGHHDRSALRKLPPMPVAELHALAAALRHLADALAQAESDRQRLARQVLTLQEDERARLARELHDELGQRLTAIRVDAAWLARKVGDQGGLRSVVGSIATQCAQMQQDVRGLLARLQPLDPAADGETEPLAKVAELLHELAAAWQRSDGADFSAALRCRARDALGDAIDWPARTTITRALALALYRLTQEALTNVARHARATRAWVGLTVEFDRRRIAWEVIDDGIGLPAETATARGNGLAGMRERVWALGGTLTLEPLRPGSTRPGLRLHAAFGLADVAEDA